MVTYAKISLKMVNSRDIAGRRDARYWAGVFLFYTRTMCGVMVSMSAILASACHPC